MLQFAEALAELPGETTPRAVTQSLREPLDAVRRRAVLLAVDELDDIAIHCAGLPLRDARDADHIHLHSLGRPGPSDPKRIHIPI